MRHRVAGARGRHPRQGPRTRPPTRSCSSTARTCRSGQDGENWDHQGRRTRPRQESGITTKDSFGDCQLHVEFATPGGGQGERPGPRQQRRLHDGQVRGADPRLVREQDLLRRPVRAASTSSTPPMVNASRKPGEWQTYDIIFDAPRFADDGKVAKPAVRDGAAQRRRGAEPLRAARRHVLRPAAGVRAARRRRRRSTCSSTATRCGSATSGSARSRRSSGRSRRRNRRSRTSPQRQQGRTPMPLLALRACTLRLISCLLAPHRLGRHRPLLRRLVHVRLPPLQQGRDLRVQLGAPVVILVRERPPDLLLLALRQVPRQRARGRGTRSSPP